MRTNRPSTTVLAACTLLLSLMAAEASAATLRVTCEARPGRAKVSVDAKGLAAGSYRSEAVSGGNSAAAAAQAAVAGEIESDYDSNAADVRAGAVAIPSTFIQNGSVTGKVVDANGNTVISDTVACRVRTR
ncbi:hypothetical protein [Inhella sp.]|uniref:hypothetical protein n=1 Tax=Inhella sp. TaxID=1921806 RepID=UPI0035AFB42D